MNGRQRKLLMMMGAAALLLAGTGAISRLGVPGFGGDGTASADDGRSEPGVAGDNPCLNRELQTPESVRAYYASIGIELQNQGDPRFLEFNQADDAWVEMVKVVVLEAMYVDPSNEASAFKDPRVPTEGYNAYTYWCTGGDVNDDGTVTWRIPELVQREPVHYEAGKAYWVIYETDTVIVAILKDCHNLIVIPKGPPPEETTTTTGPPPPPPTETTAPPVTQPPATTAPPTETTTPGTTAPPTTQPGTTTTTPGSTTTSIHPPASGPPPEATQPGHTPPSTTATTVFVPPQGPPPSEGQMPPPPQDGGYDSGSDDGSGTPNGGSCQLDANGNCIDGTVEGGGPDPDTDDNDPVVDTGTYGGMPTD